MALDDESIPKTAFIRTKVTYEFLRVAFGLVEAPTRFQKMI